MRGFIYFPLLLPFGQIIQLIMARANSFRILINWKDDSSTEGILSNFILLTKIYYLNTLVLYVCLVILQSDIFPRAFERINPASEFYRTNMHKSLFRLYERNI